mmetsp:Transcript_26930/g.48681  ORF Transcript_26930/g.48681 Transcript_26930/m.48681 type:complete len:323 (+) Transcript_26930:39-1007(+)
MAPEAQVEAEGLPISAASLLWLLSPRDSKGVKKIVPLDAEASEQQSSGLPSSWTPSWREGSPSRSTTPLLEYHKLQEGLTRSGYRSPDLSYRGAPPKVPPAARKAFEEQRQYAWHRARLSSSPVRNCIPHHQEESLDAAQAQATEQATILLEEESMDVDAEVERIAGVGRRSSPSRMQRKSPHVSPQFPTLSHRTHSRLSPRPSSRSARSPYQSHRSTSRTSSGLDVAGPRKDIWVEMKEDRRKQHRERSEILKRMHKMPFHKWEKQKTKDQQGDRSEVMPVKQTEMQREKAIVVEQTRGLNLTIKPSIRASVMYRSSLAGH